MLDLDVLNVLVHKNDEDLISTICKARQEINVLKAYVDGDSGRWSELQVNKLLNSAFGADYVKRLTAQTAEGLIARRALQMANYANWDASSIV